MSGLPAVLDVVIGLSFIFLLLSLICSAAVEYIELVFRSRGRSLYFGLIEVFASEADNTGPHGRDPAQWTSAADFVRTLYKNPLIFPLYQGAIDFDKLLGRGKLPSYLPPRLFVEALIDELRCSNGTAPTPSSPEALIDLIKKNTSLAPSLKAALETILTPTTSYEAALKRLERWFVSTTQGVSDGYRRLSQWRAAIVALVIAIGLNVDTVQIARSLQIDEDLRASLVSQAGTLLERPDVTQTVETLRAPSKPGDTAAGTADDNSGTANPETVPEPDPAVPAARLRRDPDEGMLPAPNKSMARIRELRATLGSLGLPIGWSMAEWQGCDDKGPALCDDLRERPDGAWLVRLGGHLPGWLITAIAVSFGAPFWFDILNRIMSFRTALKRDGEARN